MIEIESQVASPESKRTLMVLGKNIGEEWTGERIRQTPDHLSPHGLVGVVAGGIALEQGLADEIVFTIKNTAGKDPLSQHDAIVSNDLLNADKPVAPEAELMATKFKKFFPHLADKVRTQIRSWDTNTDAKEAKKMVKNKELNPSEFILMTIGPHLSRAAHLFRRVGLMPNLLASEDVFAVRYPELAYEYVNSGLYEKEVKKERRALRLQRLPFMADIVSFITKRSRS